MPKGRAANSGGEMMSDSKKTRALVSTPTRRQVIASVAVAFGTEPGVSDELGGSGGGDFAYGRIDPPGAHFQSEPEAGV